MSQLLNRTPVSKKVWKIHSFDWDYNDTPRLWKFIGDKRNCQKYYELSIRNHRYLVQIQRQPVVIPYKHDKYAHKTLGRHFVGKWYGGKTSIVNINVILDLTWCLASNSNKLIIERIYHQRCGILKVPCFLSSTNQPNNEIISLIQTIVLFELVHNPETSIIRKYKIVLLHNDNARPLTSMITGKNFINLKWDI